MLNKGKKKIYSQTHPIFSATLEYNKQLSKKYTILETTRRMSVFLERKKMAKKKMAKVKIAKRRMTFFNP